jgi:hypothetical protein
MAGHVARMGAKRNAYWTLVGKPKEKRSLRRPRCRWVDNIVTYLINSLPGNSSVNMIRALNSRASCVFRVSGSWRRISDITHQQYVAVT